MVDDPNEFGAIRPVRRTGIEDGVQLGTTSDEIAEIKELKRETWDEGMSL